METSLLLAAGGEALVARTTSGHSSSGACADAMGATIEEPADLAVVGLDDNAPPLVKGPAIARGPDAFQVRSTTAALRGMGHRNGKAGRSQAREANLHSDHHSPHLLPVRGPSFLKRSGRIV